jgi:hypothetical protein
MARRDRTFTRQAGQEELNPKAPGRLELKAIAELAPIHTAQLMSYLQAAAYQPGLLINFNTPVLKSGLKRLVYTPPTRR